MSKPLATYPIHLGLGATAVPQPAFAGMPWYQAYAERSAPDGIEGRLVSTHTFTERWDHWEMHPHGAEVVICTEGEITLIQRPTRDGPETSVTLTPGQYAINEPGVWHTADVSGRATAIFITAGQGTEHAQL